jgi:hypothetical protein
MDEDALILWLLSELGTRNDKSASLFELAESGAALFTGVTDRMIVLAVHRAMDEGRVRLTSDRRIQLQGA